VEYRLTDEVLRGHDVCDVQFLDVDKRMKMHADFGSTFRKRASSEPVIRKMPGFYWTK
jgi:hypothetical protein